MIWMIQKISQQMVYWFMKTFMCRFFHVRNHKQEHYADYAFEYF